jgi:hypothetical protein
LLLTWVVNTADFDLYVPVWSALLDSYEIP